jgi:hypothetical protein
MKASRTFRADYGRMVTGVNFMDTEKDTPHSLSQADWAKISSGLVLSPDDLSMIASGLALLTESQMELAELARTEHRADNLAEALEDWGKKSAELLDRIVAHHLSCIAKAAALQETPSSQD